jgi:hypothetical protein
MGQDVSIIFVADRVPVETLVNTARQAFAGSPLEYLVLMYGYAAPNCVRKAFREFTTITAWSDAEASPAPLAAELSTRYGRTLAFMMADHACVGAWQGFKQGKAGPTHWLEGEDYTAAGVVGMEAVFEVKLQATEEERRWFAEGFLASTGAVCVFGSGVLRPGQALGANQMQAIREFDFDGAELECLLLDCET